MTLDTVVQVSSNQVSCNLEGESAILNAQTGVYYGLDGVGSAIWSLLQQPRRLAEVRDEIVRVYAVDAARCGADLLKLATELAEAGLVRVCSETAV